MRTLTSLLTVALLSLSTACATVDTSDDTSADEGESAAAGKFDLWQASDAQWHFHLKSGNGAILLTSEAYTTRTGAINGALSTMNNGVDTAQYKAVAAANGGYLLHLVAGNNEIISFSQVYSSKSNATRAIASCVKATTSYLDKHESLTTGARVEVSASESGGFHFNMFAKNGQIVVASEHYTTEAAAYNGAFAVAADGQSTTAYTVLQSNDGNYYFNVKAQNGQIIGTSQLYTTKASAQAAVTATSKLMATLSVF
jgi:uncharacterized protein YegP (UPF0339 family)